MAKRRGMSALESIGGRGELQRQFRQYSQSVDYIDRDRRRLLKDYDDHWVAVYDSKVIAYAKKYDDVVRIIEQKKFPIGQIALKHLSSRKRITLY